MLVQLGLAKYGKLMMSSDKTTANEATITDLTARIESLESKLAYQEITIDQLNEEITNTTLQFAVVTRQIELLAQKVKDGKSSNIADASEETPPPHY